MHHELMAVRPEVERLVALGPMPDEAQDVPVECVKAFQDALEAIQGLKLSDDEAALLLDSFPPGEYGGLFELEWSLLHVIESAPYGPGFTAKLDDRTWWVTQLRERAQRAGLLVSPDSDMPLDLAREFSPQKLLAFIDSDFDQSAAAALEVAVAALSTEREWLLGPPEFIDVEEAGVRTVGARIQLYAPLSDKGRELPIDIERTHFEEVRTFIAGLARVSSEYRMELGVELDDDSVGWLSAGEPDDSITRGYLGEWRARLGERRNESP